MLELIPSLMLVVLLVFLGLLFYLNKSLYSPLLNFMDQRDRTIRKDLEEAGNLATGASKLEEEANALLDAAKKEAIAIRQAALDEANAKAQEKIQAKEAELEKAYEEFKKALEQEKEEVKAALLSQMPLLKESLKAKFSQL